MLEKIMGNYYVQSFFWSTLHKIIKAVVNFISVPLLLSLYGEKNYGVLSLATAANAYIHLLDLGINTGAVKYFSQWKVENKNELIDSVARTNITFYAIIGCVNALVLILLGVFGRNIFSVTDEQFYILRFCFFIIACFSIFNWISSAFNQLLVAFGKIAFVQQMQCVVAVLDISAILITVYFRFPIQKYFFVTVFINATLLLPYAFYCLKSGFISTLRPAQHWNDFKIVLLYSLNIFALSLFQMTATNSRPIILGIFSSDAATVSAEYRILSVVPGFILMLGGMVSTILLPKASETVASSDRGRKERIAYKGTELTSVLANVLCIPFIICASEFLCAYVGEKYTYLSFWLSIWCVTVLIQIHTTPCNSLILATGKTLRLVIVTAVNCMISIIINALLAKQIGIGSAVLGYLIYVVMIIGFYYVFFYQTILQLNGFKIFVSFLKPTFVSFLAFGIVLLIPFGKITFWNNYSRLSCILKCLIKACVWGVTYFFFLLGIIKARGRNRATK